MKRHLLIPIFLLSIMLFFLACNTEEPEETVAPEEPGETIENSDDTDTDTDTDAMGDRLSKTYIDMMKSEKYTLKYKAIMDMDGVEMETLMTMAISEGRTAMQAETAQTNHTTIIDDGEFYIIDHNGKTVMQMPSTTVDTSEEAPSPEEIDAAKLEYVGSGSGEFMGNTRDYEEYKVDDTSLLYYFDGDELDGMEIKSESGSVIMDIEEMSADVDESMFEIPEDYELIKVGS